MSGFIPGLASRSIPLFEENTEIVLSQGTTDTLSFPDNIPVSPPLAYSFVPPSPNPVSYTGPPVSYIVSCIIPINSDHAGNGAAVLTFRLGGSGMVTNGDYLQDVCMKQYVDVGYPSFVISFTGLVKVLPGATPKLYVEKASNGDTTTYQVASAPVINFKTL